MRARNHPRNDRRNDFGVSDPGNADPLRTDRRRMTSRRSLAGLSLLAPLVLVGCYHAPEYSIFGSFFPAWIFCSVGGLVLITGTRALVARTAIAEHLAAPVLLYLAMATFLACILWLLFYS
jgi:YtcA family